MVLTLSGENELVKVKSKDGTVRLTGTPSTTLRWGSRGDAVRTLQENLNKLGYYTEEPDGIFGDKTVAAVMTFQKAYNLTQNGMVDTATKGAIEKAMNYHNQGILTVGSRGEAVRTLQEILTGLGYDTKGTDGIFGNNTKNAVIAFQRDHGINPDGIVGDATKKAISYIMREQTSGSTGGMGNVNLSLGSQGEAVATLQRNLTMLGYDTKRSDGYFDINTKNAVMEFQRAYDLEDDGVVGPDTRNALAKALDYHSRGILTKGSRGDAVETLQRNLMLLGYYKDNPDGIFGANTEKAVRLFQRVHALNPDGIVGVATRDAIKRALSSPIEASNGNLGIKSWGEEVETLQRNLTQLGYYSGNVDGYFDENTENAVIAFQNVCGIKPDGVAGFATKGLIEDALAYQRNGVLGLGIRSTDVSVLQGKLSKLGYYAGKVNGSFGRATSDAVSEFQKAHGLVENGVVDAKTLEAINGALNTNGAGNTNDTILVKEIELSKGSSGEEVKVLQESLSKLGYDTLGVDGKFGDNTLNAVKMFQALHNLEVTGVVGRETWRELSRALQTDDSKPIENWDRRQQMLDNIKNDTSLGLSEDKRTALLTAAERLLRENFDPRFVAGVLGNILSEGKLGQFESSNYKSNPEKKKEYLIYMDEHLGYAANFSGKSIQTVGISAAVDLANKAKASGIGKFGLGLCQWTGDRTIGVLEYYQKYAQNDKPTTEECIKAEINFMVDELKGEFSYVYLNWLAGEKTEYNAGDIFCTQYEIPGDTSEQAKIRGANAQQIYRVMMK